MDTLVSDIYTRINRKTVPTVKLNDPVKEPEDPAVIIVKE
jgi:hypothetical protein